MLNIKISNDAKNYRKIRHSDPSADGVATPEKQILIQIYILGSLRLPCRLAMTLEEAGLYHSPHALASARSRCT